MVHEGITHSTTPKFDEIPGDRELVLPSYHCDRELFQAISFTGRKGGMSGPRFHFFQ